jgi:hypothetical protein
MKGRMSQATSLIFWAGLMTATLVAPALLLHADDAPASSDGYRIVPVTVNGHTVPIKVRDSDPFKNVKATNTSDKYDPQSLNFGASSSMANKKFDSPGNALSQGDTGDQHQTFLTKPYSDNNSAPSAPDLHTKATYPTKTSYNKSASDSDKSFGTKRDSNQDRTALLAKADSDDQNHTALLNSKPIDTPAATIANKTFEGPEADAVHRRLTKTDDGKMAVSDLPDRPLTIDEVKNLINHGFKPNTNAKPEEESSKPLNDPAYKPEPLRESPTPVGDDDKNDAVPPPGTMAAPQPPENSEPLPQPKP